VCKPLVGKEVCCRGPAWAELKENYNRIKDRFKKFVAKRTERIEKIEKDLSENLVEEVSEMLNDNQAMVRTDAYKMKMEKFKAIGKKTKDGKDIHVSPVEKKKFDPKGQEVCRGKYAKVCLAKKMKMKEEMEKKEQEMKKKEDEWMKKREDWKKKWEAMHNKTDPKKPMPPKDGNKTDPKKPMPPKDGNKDNKDNTDGKPRGPGGKDGKRFLQVLRDMKSSMSKKDQERMTKYRKEKEEADTKRKTWEKEQKERYSKYQKYSKTMSKDAEKKWKEQSLRAKKDFEKQMKDRKDREKDTREAKRKLAQVARKLNRVKFVKAQQQCFKRLFKVTVGMMCMTCNANYGSYFW